MLTSILIADSQRMFREGLRGILEGQTGFEIVAECEDGPQTVAAAAEKQPQIALIDTRLPRLSGIAAIQRISGVSSQTRCIALSGLGGPSDVTQALVAGACGFVPKSAPVSQLVEAIHKVRAGGSYLSPSVAEDIVDTVTSGWRMHGKTGITSRQREVLQLIAEGMSTPLIATELGIAQKTVQTHRAALMDRLGAHKASELVRYAIREGIIAA